MENFSGDYIRHSKAGYKTYQEALKSDDPQQSFNPEIQITPDLDETGVEFARANAEKYFDGLNPDTDKLFFVSSNEARALETANVYRQIAQGKGFEIIKPEHSRSGLSDKISEGDIRTLETLSINSENILIESIFNPASRRGEINWAAVSPGQKEKYEKAAAIVDADDQGSWGANFAKHSESVQTIFPKIKSSKDLFETKFSRLLRLLEFGEKKAAESGVEGNIKVLAFGHENMITYALDQYFRNHELKNCEVVNFIPSENGVDIGYRGDHKTI